MNKKQLSEAASMLGKRSYQARLQRLGIERLRDHCEREREARRPPPQEEER